ncbi:MAG: hypothetical protein OM95_10070 [Bdellovibrio sp. ArHS]|uniref:DUF2127 domain-containing protein n=1 Tax=Bdellovibrio sp. ArHS TaxID=1569284 RepID=UPI000582A37B|nr:DUF2127 domain-containing protein [Bdellovibrio sp. ArHS]KHD88243.1 MAG: hypothetical protein OM95_10070 [Bdellovibrio sp. ArHS]
MSGLRVIALFEFLKGLTVLTAGLGFLELLHYRAQHVGEQFLAHAGLNAHHQIPKPLAQYLSGISDHNMQILAIGVVAYCALRWVEAYGLWRERSWAQWLGIVSGGIYLPYEFYESWFHFSWIKVAITLVNIVVVVYLVRTREQKKV